MLLKEFSFLALAALFFRVEPFKHFCRSTYESLDGFNNIIVNNKWPSVIIIKEQNIQRLEDNET